MRTLIIIIAIFALLLIIRFFYRQSSPNLKKIGRNLAIGLAAGIFLILLATGRLHWLFAAAAAAVPLVLRMLPLLRYVPLLKNLYKKYQNRQGGSGGSGTASQTSSVRSRYIHMTLNLDSGEVNGEVLEGQFSGRKLDELSLQELFALLQECEADSESVSLLVAFLDRNHPEWREEAQDAGSSQSYQSAGDSSSGASSKMTADEAYEILGLPKDATEEQINEAHRKLIHKLHPDHGGSTYLSAKINLAKDTLLKRK